MLRILLLSFLGVVLGAFHLQADEQEQPKIELKKLFADLKSENDDTKLALIRALIEFGPQAEPAIGDLIVAMASTNEHLRLNSAIALGKIGKAAVPDLTKLLSSPDTGMRYYAVWALGLVGSDAKETTDKVVKLLSDADDGVRRKAAFALGRIQPDANVAMPVLFIALQDKDGDVRGAAGAALVQFGRKAVPGAMELLKEDDKFAIREVLYLVGAIGPDAKAAIPELKRLLFEKYRRDAAETLAKIGKEAIPTLVEGVENGQFNVHYYSLTALATLGAEGVPHLITAMDNKRLEVRREATELLSSIRPPDKATVLALAKALWDEDVWISGAAFNGLQYGGSAVVVALPQLIAGLKDREPLLRFRCATVLGKIGPDARAAVPALSVTVDDGDATVRISAKKALEKIEKK